MSVDIGEGLFLIYSLFLEIFLPIHPVGHV